MENTLANIRKFQPSRFTGIKEMPISFLDKIQGKDKLVLPLWGNATISEIKDGLLSNDLSIILLDKGYRTADKDGNDLFVPIYGSVQKKIFSIGQRVGIFMCKGPGTFDITVGIGSDLKPTETSKVYPMMIFTAREDGLVDALSGFKVEGGKGLNSQFISSAREIRPFDFNDIFGG